MSNNNSAPQQSPNSAPQEAESKDPDSIIATVSRSSFTTPTPSPDCRPLIKWIFTNPENAHALANIAVVAGYECYHGNPLWLIRAQFQNELLPGELYIERNLATVPWGGKENRVHYIEVCCAHPDYIRWIQSSDGCMPPNAVIAGYMSNGDALYVGRVYHEGSLIPGKLAASYKTLYVSYQGKEITFKQYEVMCLNVCNS